jgi:hypothetical protein
MYKAVKMNSEQFGEKQWQELEKLSETLHKKYNSPYYRTTWQNTRDQVLNVYKMEKSANFFAVFENDKMVGMGMIRLRNEGEPDQSAFFAGDADFDAIPEEFAKLSGRMVAEHLGKFKCDKIWVMTATQRISDMIRYWGIKELNRIDRFVLNRQTANYDMINECLNTIPAQNPDLRMKFYTEIPEKYIKRYAMLFQRFIDEMPTERELDGPKSTLSAEQVRHYAELRKKNNRYLYCLALHDTNDVMIAHTNGFISGDDPTDTYQAMTGVVERYRGRKLAKWLKAALFMKVGEDFPGNKTFTTDMRAVNDPIQYINTQMGFKQVSDGNEFEGTRNDFNKYLK